MKQVHRALATGLLALVMALSIGCASIEKAETFNGANIAMQGQNVGHYNVKSSGLYFLTSVPLITGNTETFGLIPAFFKDTVALDNLVGVMTREATNEGAAQVLDIQSGRGGFPVIFPPILFWKSCNVSGNGVK